jgi:hypothetical protein
MKFEKIPGHIQRAKVTGDSEFLSLAGKKGAEARKRRELEKERVERIEHIKAELDYWEHKIGTGYGTVNESGDITPESNDEEILAYVSGLKDELEKLTGIRQEG